MIAIDLGKQNALDADPKATQQVNFHGNLENQSKILFTIQEAKETVQIFLRELQKNSNFIFALI